MKLLPKPLKRTTHQTNNFHQIKPQDYPLAVFCTEKQKYIFKLKNNCHFAQNINALIVHLDKKYTMLLTLHSIYNIITL